MITSYDFGKMTIEGKTYSTDLIILGDMILPNWWRKEGHRLVPNDLKDVMSFQPDVLVVGTGYMGMMQVPDETKECLRREGIEIVVANSRKSWKLYNEMKEGRKTAAVFHLTC